MADVIYYFDEYPSGTVLTNQYDYVTFIPFDGGTVQITSDGSQTTTVMNGRGNRMCCAPVAAGGGGMFKGNFGFTLNASYRVSFTVGYTDNIGSTTITCYDDIAMTDIVDVFVPGSVGFVTYTSAMAIRAMKLVQVNEAAGTEIDNLTLFNVNPNNYIKRQRQSPKGTPSRVGWR